MLQNLKESYLIAVEFFQHATKLTWSALGITVAIGFLYFGIMFRQRDGFDDPPSDLSPMANYRWIKVKVMALIVLCLVSYHLAYHQLPEWFPSFFRSK